MARGYFRTGDSVCLYCGYMKDNFNSNGQLISREKMPYKIGKGADKTYLCEKCFNKTKESKELDIKKIY